MAVKDYQLEPGLNMSISGINIAEGCPPSGINDAIRQLMADVKAESDARQQAEATNAQAAQYAAQVATQASQSVNSLGATLRSEMDSAVAGAKYEAASANATLESSLSSLVQGEKSFLLNQIWQSAPTGMVIAFAGNFDPAGFLLCNGATISRTTYANLFSVIGGTYGQGDGWSTFTLPNLEDRFIMGKWQAGYYLEAGLPDHSHVFGHTQSLYYTTVGYDAFYTTGYRSDGDASKQHPDAAKYSLSYASAWNGIYGRSGTVQPPALTMRYYIKY